MLSLNNIQEILAIDRTSWVMLMPAVLKLSSLITWKVLNEKIFYYNILKRYALLRYATRICIEKLAVPFKKFDLTYKWFWKMLSKSNSKSL